MGLRFEVELFGGGDKATTQIRGLDVRRMYAILSADVFGYTRLVEQDDLATARQLEGCLKIARDRVQQMDGRIFQVVGDEIVALFNSAGSAVKSAVAMAIGHCALATERCRRRAEWNFGSGSIRETYLSRP